MGKYAVACERLAGAQADLTKFKQSHVQEMRRAAALESQPSQGGDRSKAQSDRSRYAVHEAEAELKKAKDRVAQHTLEVQRLEAKSALAKERIKSLKGEALQVEKDRADVITKMQAVGMSVERA